MHTMNKNFVKKCGIMDKLGYEGVKMLNVSSVLVWQKIVLERGWVQTVTPSHAKCKSYSRFLGFSEDSVQE